MKKCLVTIRRRKEPVEVDEERGRKIKLLRFGDVDGNGKAEPDTDIDLGDEWSGKLDQIVSIEFVKVSENNGAAYNPEEDWKKHEAELLKLSPAERAESMGSFKMSWFMRSKMQQKQPPAKVLAEAKKIATKFFEKNPRVATLPSNVLEPLLQKHFGKDKGHNLAESKRI